MSLMNGWRGALYARFSMGKNKRAGVIMLSANMRDYSMSPLASKLGVSPKDARLFMVATSKWKFMHAEGGFPPMLFDLQADPQELRDVGRSPDYQEGGSNLL